MFRFHRAAGYAAAILTVALGAAYARPSLASEVETAPAFSYLDHDLIAPVDIAGPAQSGGATRAFDPNFTQPVAEHAVAAVEPEAVEEEQRLSLAELVDAYAGEGVIDAEHECLAGAVYFESKGEPLRGQLAVAEVVLNRAQSGRFPATVCGVVKQKSQFSFVRGGRIPAAPRGSAAWRKAVAIAHIAREELADGGVPDALFFHANYVSPRWKRARVASIGNHIFYR